MTTIVWLSESLTDLQRLYEFIAEHNARAAARAASTLLDAVKSLRKFPEKRRPWDAEPSYRSLSVRFGARDYVVRHRLFEEQVIVVRVWYELEDR
ncbi:MAG: type II toxin-antitoxin system RelE/ParE family toxin [Pseudomonadota bacterium]